MGTRPITGSYLDGDLGNRDRIFPGIAAWTYFGGEILDWFMALTAATWVPLGVALVVFITFRIYLRRRNESKTNERDRHGITNGIRKAEFAQE